MVVVKKPLGERYLKGMTVREHMALELACASLMDPLRKMADEGYAIKNGVRLADKLISALEKKE